MSHVKNVPTKKQASILLGEVTSFLLNAYKFPNYDWENFVAVDSAKGINWVYTLNKLTHHWGKMNDEIRLKVGAINLFCVDADDKTFPLDQVLFTAGLFGAKTDWNND